MTREEAINQLQDAKDGYEEYLTDEALDMAIKALEQEPCEDAIRRADAEALFRNARSKLNPSDYKTADEFNTRDLMLLNAEQFIHLLPSVTPQEPKTGHWIYINPTQSQCSNCDALQLTNGRDLTGKSLIHYANYRYCPHCGARMIRNESGDKE